MRALSLVVIIFAACTSAPSAGGGGGGDDTGSGSADARIDSPGGGGGGGGGSTRPFDPAVTSVVIEIDYETAQQPYTGAIVGFGDTFDISSANLNRLFANKKPITLPRTTADM